MEKLTVKEIKMLERTVVYENTPDSYWQGKSDGIIHEGLYLKVYPARSSYGSKVEYMKCSSINVPLNKIYTF